MKILPIVALTQIIMLPILVTASNPRGDDLKVGEIECRTHNFTLSPGLRAKATNAKAQIIEEGRFGGTRTNPDGIIVSLKIEDDSLWVTGIGISGGEGSYSVKPTVIPTDIVSKSIRADWFSGKLTGYYGRPLRFHLREFGYVFQVKEGKVTSRKKIRFK